MAKVRVYELAKELKLESKELVEKLKTGGLDIKNYMSTLDETLVAEAREIVSGVKSKVVQVEEKRIKPRVIRRRKKAVEVEAEIPEVKPEETSLESLPEESAVETVEESVEVDEGLDTPVVKDEAIPKESDADKESGVEEPPSKPKAKAKKAKRKGKDQPAKIIKKAEDGPLKERLTKDKKGKEEKPVERKKKPRLKKAPKEDKPVIPVDLGDETPKEKTSRKRKDKKKSQKKETDANVSVRHRKVEVFERADLYEGRKPRQKDRKGGKKGKDTSKSLKGTEITQPKAIKRRLTVQEEVTVADLSKAMSVKATEVIKKLLTLGVMANINKFIDFETATVVADEFGFELELDHLEAETILEEVEDKPEDLKPRSPVVTIMGHVDHGKTSLLDYLRESNIIGAESGGITQHIGAYDVETKGGNIVFLDTPGHEAFTAMRARGAKVTDIIVLVVAADDGVMPQTKEAVNHGRAANIPIIVAINKMDKPEADPDKVTRELSELGLSPEDWGGDTIFGKISAKTGDGIDELMELILLQSEMLELKANPDKTARGTIIEAHLNKSKGSVATVLIKNGTLSQSDYFVCGGNYGRIRAMINTRGKKIKTAGPSVPVEIYGISGVPMAGDEFIVVTDEKSARQLVEHRQAKVKAMDHSKLGIVSLDDLYLRIKEGAIKELNIVLKTDVQGSLEALAESLIKLSTEEVKLNIVHSSTGGVTETDVMLASASGAIVIGFNVRANPRVMQIADKEKVDVRFYDVIYKVLENIRLAMTGLLDPIYKENVIGRADIKETFNVPKIGTVAGCYVTDGYIERNSKVRLLRDEVVVFDGAMASLRRFKDDVKEVQTGYECGIGLEDFKDIKPGDVFEVYQIEEVKAEL
ncbi:translation initiation factor IF-2 [Thermodesulfobacteriota bacterium]